MPEQPIPTSLMASIELSRQAVEDVANPGLPQDIADPDISGKAVMAIQSRLDQQSIVYQQNLKHAKRRDAEVYASMASKVYDAPRKVLLTMADGNTKTVEIMEAGDKDTLFHPGYHFLAFYFSGSHVNIKGKSTLIVRIRC